MTRGAQAQAFGHIVRVVIQLAGVPIFISVWGLHLYGEWLILTAVPSYLAFSDIGFVSAAGNEMIMSIGRNDREHALSIFQAVSLVVAAVVMGLLILLPAAASVAPLTTWLKLTVIHESAAGWIVLALSLDAMLALFASLLYGGYACEGRYGEGAFAIAAISLVEFAALALAVILGGGPGLAAGAMFAGRAVGTLAMLVGLRRHAPWLRFGVPHRPRSVLRGLLSPALAAGAFPVGFALNLQGMVILVGTVAGPANAAIFSTLRTVSRAVTQVLASVSSVVSPEVSKAFGEGDLALVRMIHRRGCQVAVWLAGSAVLVLGIFGGPILLFWTSGKVGSEGALLYLFLMTAAVDAFWYTSFAILFATNRHQRVAVHYVLANVLSLPVAFALLKLWGLSGAASALVLLELYMLFVVLRQALPAAGDSVLGLAAFIRVPPVYLLGRLARLRPGYRS
ncbi:MAG: lipopolysaccharide biosynthesis protein [Solirubrobacteraceae bacterium]